MAIESETSQPEGSPFNARPPLWEPKPAAPPSRTLLAIAVLAVVAIMLLVTLGGEGTYFSSPAQPVKVSVQRIDGVSPPNDAPADYRYFVTLPDGREARYMSPDRHRVGDTVIVLQSRGLITGRTQLARPASAREVK